MRGGVARWKRGVGSAGVRGAVAYAFGGACDATYDPVHADGALSAAHYAGNTVTRYTATAEGIARDQLDPEQLKTWFEGYDIATGERRGRDLSSPATDLVLDATINAPKSFSVAAILDPDIADAYDGLQDRLRDLVVGMWREELNARRGAGGARREDLAQIEVVELKHERSRSLDPHKHRHLWLNTRVKGQDGEWSTVDSRVMLRFQTVINAEGDLAARTDPQWVAALAAKGYTLAADGEIEQLAAVVRPLSRRANQIESNRAVKLAQWRIEHPGQEADRTVLAAIDRWAWALDRPNKPATVDEDNWADTVRREIADIDPAIVRTGDRSPVPVDGTAIADIDRDLLASIAVTEADDRAAASGGRFSMFDVRAGAGRAVAGSGVVAERAQLSELIEDVAARAVGTSTVSLLEEDGAPVPGHVKGMMATTTAALKLTLSDRLDQLNEPGLSVEADTVTAVADRVLLPDRSLDAGQRDAAAAIAGTDRLVTVTGPAGTGKTTMLRVVREMLSGQGRSLVIVAPTKKAASVAGREIGATASSLHALLHDHGFRWQDSPTGQRWTRLKRGQADPATGHVWEGPTKFTLGEADRIVVDEAGMVDLRTADALTIVAQETGAGIAMVGDHLQALPVGHSGAMSMMRSRSSAVVELSAVHRFEDPEWANLTLRLREPESETAAAETAVRIVAGGHGALVANDTEARQHMVEAYFQAQKAGDSVCLVTATHEQAQEVNEAIQRQRLERGQLNTKQRVTAQHGQIVYGGDIVQTRRNDGTTDVENRQTWIIGTSTAARVQLHSTDDAGVTRTVSAQYLASHSHLSYATTVHGVQGETAARSVVGPGVDAAGLYVGLTRGRKHNEAVLIAGSETAARAQLVETMQRGTVEATLDEARSAARADLSRAARTGEQARVTAPWTDHHARPLGRVVNLDRVLESEIEKEVRLHKQVADLGNQIGRIQRTLEQIDAKSATWAARQHAADLTGQQLPGDPPPTPTVRQTFLDRLEARRSERATLAKEHGKAARRIRQVHAETATRHMLPEPLRSQENEARIRNASRRAQQQHTSAPATSVNRDSGPSIG